MNGLNSNVLKQIHDSGVAIWGFATPGLAANSARDVGGRLAALSIWGMKASGGTYAAIAALTNIPAMLIAVAVYEFFLTDSSRGMDSYVLRFLTPFLILLPPIVMPSAQLEFMIGHQKHHEQHGGPPHRSPYNKDSDEKGNTPSDV